MDNHLKVLVTFFHAAYAYGNMNVGGDTTYWIGKDEGTL
jgi:hypothetical protein